MSAPRFSDDSDMAYAASRTRFAPDAPFRLDALYCLAHLPLVAPEHPDVIAGGNGYVMGIHAPVHSLVLSIDGAALEASAGYRALMARLRAASFSGKIAWEMLPRRRDRLHATVCGEIDTDGAGKLPNPLAAQLAGVSRFRYRIGGLFSGDRNHGRLYLAVYPEMRDGENALAQVGRIFGRTPFAMYLVGLVNLNDHLAPSEAGELEAVLTEFSTTLFLEAEADALDVLRSADDLVLDAAYTDCIVLS